MIAKNGCAPRSTLNKWLSGNNDSGLFAEMYHSTILSPFLTRAREREPTRSARFVGFVTHRLSSERIATDHPQCPVPVPSNGDTSLKSNRLVSERKAARRLPLANPDVRHRFSVS
jgi:hypothetical protein